MALDYQIFDAGNVRLQRGETLRDCKLAYKTFGKMNTARDNVIVYPTWYSGQHTDNEWLIGPGMALDPDKYFIIIPNMLGNGLSSSPSNMPAPYNGAWQHGDISDNELYRGDFKKALAAIKAKAYVMPGQTDLYFPPEDSQFEVAHMPNAKFLPVPSIWGHFAGGPGTNPEDVKFLDAALKELLAA
jgi:homoserine acetyltransferase